MRMTDLIAKKRDGERLTTEEITEMLRLYTAGEIPDYQMSARCMAILFRGMDDGEILGFDARAYLTAHTSRTLPEPVLTK